MSSDNEIEPMRKLISVIDELKSFDLNNIINNGTSNALHALAVARMNASIAQAVDVGADVGDNQLTGKQSVNDARRDALKALDNCHAACNDIIDVLHDIITACDTAYRAIGEVEAAPPADGIADGSVYSVNAYVNGRLQNHYHDLFT